MPLPFEYQNASLQFDQFMLDARDYADLATTNMAWNMVVGVLRAFRARLNLVQALHFATALPPVLRALFIEDWDIDAPVRQFGSESDWLADVRALRPQHNFSPDNAVAAVAAALRQHVDHAAFEHALASLPMQARIFWGWPEQMESGR